MLIGPIQEALHTAGPYQRIAKTEILGKTDASGITVDHITGAPDANTKAKIYKAYQNTWWEFEPGEERADHAARFDNFLGKQKNLTTLVAHHEKTGETVGLLYAYDNPIDHPLQTGSDVRLAGIAVSENMQKHGIGTRLVQAHNEIFSKLGHQKVVLAYDEPGERLYNRFNMQPGAEMRVKVPNSVQRQKATPESNVRTADLRVKGDAATVFSFEKTAPEFAKSTTSFADAAKFWMEQPENKAWIAVNPRDKHPEGAVLTSEWRYPVAQTWTPEYLKMMTIPGVRTGSLDRSSGDITSHGNDRRDVVANALLDEALEHAKTRAFTNVRVADRGDVEHVLQSRGFTQAPVLELALNTSMAKH